MAIRKQTEETLVLEGSRDIWLERARAAAASGGFKKVTASTALNQVTAKYRKATAHGDLTVTLTPAGDATTSMRIQVNANVDNAFALFKSPGKKITEAFKSGLG